MPRVQLCPPLFTHSGPIAASLVPPGRPKAYNFHRNVPLSLPTPQSGNRNSEQLPGTYAIVALEPSYGNRDPDTPGGSDPSDGGRPCARSDPALPRSATPGRPGRAWAPGGGAVARHSHLWRSGGPCRQFARRAHEAYHPNGRCAPRAPAGHARSGPLDRRALSLHPLAGHRPHATTRRGPQGGNHRQPCRAPRWKPIEYGPGREIKWSSR